MGTVPTGKLEAELRKLYLQWLAGADSAKDPKAYLDIFEKKSRALISRLGGQTASLGALAGFPVPKTLELSPRAGVIYDEMRQAAISASITAGLNSVDAARQMYLAGLDKNFNKLKRLARTETTSAYWKNQWDSVADLPLIVMVWGSESSKKTCDYCLSRDGLVVEDANIRDHPNGRCTLIPTLRSQVKYKGTLQPDGSVTMDPKWTGKAEKVKTVSAGPTTAEQRDPMSGKSNPAAPSKAQPAQASAPKIQVTNSMNMTNEQKLRQAEIMYGTNSPQYQLAQKKFGAGSVVKPIQPPVVKNVKPVTGRKFQPNEDKLLDHRGVPFTATQKEALTNYTFNDYESINSSLRGLETADSYVKSQIKAIDGAMKRAVLPYDVAVTRSVSADAFGGIDELKKLVGGIFEEPGYLSTTLADSAVNKAQVVMQVTLPQGTKAIHMAQYSQYSNEREILVDRGAKLAIESVTRSGSKWVVKAILVP